ncbi:MAG: hypothetical protein KC897_04605 [Candidatus Omnitrophica bacterium]|nr:hypothetical protein [Candidatus Omnitrophota bacterium]MCB9722209.1 hypothetical protein [Candidatus Omnitrophota bacterium]
MALITQLILLAFTYLFAVWVLDIFDFDFTQGNQWVISFFIAAVLVYWRLGSYLVPDMERYLLGGVLLLSSASIYRSQAESGA